MNVKPSSHKYRTLQDYMDAGVPFDPGVSVLTPDILKRPQIAPPPGF